MGFKLYYNWLRFSILTPSYFIQNRLILERSFQVRLIYSFFGFTNKNYVWGLFNGSAVDGFLWKNVYYGLFAILCWVVLYWLLSFNFLIFNFPIRYWFIYISWRAFDGFYFFFLQFQYLIIVSIFACWWVLLNTYFNVQFNLLYLVLFYYFNINTDIRDDGNLKLIRKTDQIDLLYTASAIFNNSLIAVSYYFYSIKYYLNTPNFNAVFWNTAMGNVSSCWTNFIYNTSIKTNARLLIDSQVDNLNVTFYLINTIKFNWFISLNNNNIFYKLNLTSGFNFFITNWFKVLKTLRWNLINLNVGSSDILTMKSFILNFYTLQNVTSDLVDLYWLSSFEWFIYRWLSLFKTIQLSTRSLNFTVDTTSIAHEGTWRLWKYDTGLLNWVYFNKYCIQSSTIPELDTRRFPALTDSDFLLAYFPINLFLYETTLFNYLLLYNNTRIFYWSNRYCIFAILNYKNTFVFNSVWTYYIHV